MAGITTQTSDGDSASPPPKKKGSFFTRRAIRQVSDAAQSESSTNKQASEDDDLQLFRRSKEIFPRAIKERDEERKRPKSDSGVAERNGYQSQDKKRIKLSVTADDPKDDIYSDDIYGVSDEELERRNKKPAGKSSVALGDPVTPPPSGSSKPASGSRHASVHERGSMAHGNGPDTLHSLPSPIQSNPAVLPWPLASAETIVLSDDEDEPTATSQQVRSGPQDGGSTAPWADSASFAGESFFHRAEDNDEEISETAPPEFEEYIIRAQARNAAARAARELARTAPKSGVGERNAGAADNKRMPTPADPMIRICVVSRLTGVDVPPVIVTRLLSQDMKKVRDYFIMHARSKGASLSDAEASNIILTWKGNKIYNHTTGVSLRVTPDSEGMFRDGTGARIKQRPGFHDGGLHIEAWPGHLYEDYLKEKAKERDRQLGDLDESDLDMSDAGQEAKPEPVAKIRLVLKARDHEPLKMTAHLDTTIQTMVDIFRKQRGMGPEKHVSLYWDGDRLAPEMTVGEAEMENMDCIEVHIS